MRRIVVIGNSLATAKVAARIKRLEPSHEVNLVVAATPQTGASGPFADAHAARRASLEMVRNRDVGVVEADDLAVDFEARTVFVTSSRGSLPVRYHTLILEVSADPKLPRALRKAEGVLPWPGDGYGVQNALAARPGCRPVVVGQGQYTLEALRLLQEADLTPTWVRTRDDEDLLDADVWRAAAGLAAANGVRVQDLTRVGLERMGAVPDDKGGIAALVDTEGHRVEGDLFLWTAPLTVQHPVLAEGGMGLDPSGRLAVDGFMRSGIPDVHFLGTGVCLPGEEGEPAATVTEEDLPVMARLLAEHVASGVEVEWQPGMRALYVEGPGFGIARMGATQAEATRMGLETDFVLLPIAGGGMLKLIADKASGLLIGVQGVADVGALDMMVPVASLALGMGLEASAMAEAVLPGPGGNLFRKAAAMLANKLASGFYGISAEELLASREAGAEFFMLDLRFTPEWREGHIEGAYNIPFPQLKKRLQDEVPRYTPLVLISRTSDAAWSTACKLYGLGAKDIYVLDGGMDCWPFDVERA